MRVDQKTDSPIEESIYQELLKYNLTPIPQYQIGSFFIDLAFPEIKLAIEADGKEYHSSPEQKKRDNYREDRIKSQGWTFERFEGSLIHRHKDYIAAKIALKYFYNQLSEEKRELATGRVINFFMLNKKDMTSTLNLFYVSINGFYTKRIGRQRKIK